MKKYFMDRTGINILRVLMFGANIILISISYTFLKVIPILMWALICLFIAGFIFFGLIWLPLLFTRTYFCVSNFQIICNTGFFIRKKQIMKMNAVQYATIITTPFSKITGINFLIANALGGNILLTLISKNDAEEILRIITDSINTDKKYNS